MTKPYSYQKWQTPRTWPGGGWGEAMSQVRKDQRLSQRDVADYVGVSLATVRRWEDGLALPDRDLWPKVEEAMGMPVPDPRVPDLSSAERELIDTMLLLIDELRHLRDHIGDLSMTTPVVTASDFSEPKLLDVEGAAKYLGVKVSSIRNLIAQRSVVHYKVGRRAMFKREDIDQFVEQNKRELPDFTPWQLKGRQGKSPRKPTAKKQSVPPAQRRKPISKAEIAEARWTVAELGKHWWGVDSAKALLELAGVVMTADSGGQETFRYGDLVSWVEGHQTEFRQWLQQFDPAFGQR